MKGKANIVRFLGVIGLSVVGAASSQAFTVATFFDPSNGTTPLFELTPTQLNGGWSGTGLQLELAVAGVTVNDATFTMTPLTRTSSSDVSGGTISFFNKLGADVLDVNFDKAEVFSPYGMGASFLNLQHVQFNSPLIPNSTKWNDEQFSISFANATVKGNQTSFTGSFTSSAAAAVPEPASMAGLLIGGSALIARRRKKKQAASK